MEWTKNFIIPVTKLVFIVGLWGFISIVISRAFYIKWNKQWKWFIKYKVKKKLIDKEIIEMVLSIKDIDNTTIKKRLLINNYKIKQINELFYLKKIVEGIPNGKTKRKQE